MWYSVLFSQQRSLSSTSTSPPTPAALPWLPVQGLFSSIPGSSEMQSSLALQRIPSRQEA